MSKWQKYNDEVISVTNTILLEIENMKEENPEINRLGNNCFTINIHDLDNDLNLSPFHYDWLKQYNTIIEIIKSRQPQDALNIIEDIILKGCVVYRRTRHIFCDTVRNKLRKCFY